MSSSENEEIRDYFNGWLDAMMAVYGEVLEEWEENNYVQPFPDAQVTFKCNDCGKCCNFEQHDVWVYPSDMVKWLNEYETEKWIPLYLCALLPVQDLDGITGLGLPSQKNLTDQYREIMKKMKDKTIVQTLQAILDQLKVLNPSFDEKSDFCVYYNTNPKQGTGHCSIYEHRPIQCRSYPYDFPQFTKFVIPGQTEEIDLEDLPRCPPKTYTHGDPKRGVLTNADQRENVTFEKANYRTSSIIHDWAEESLDWKGLVEEDIGDIILEIFHKGILNLWRKSKVFPKPGGSNKGAGKRYVAGKRPQKSTSFKGKKKYSKN
ncbi:YkgJ family cysteine cluster protein [Candidatus Lokiarchaeum ossiferum]|uniref:YkgJ family cysteine cluster protein n=1 Tax=Candidatus Lokiarchaeum ossiferum TaxID=2951803 RepID=UPI00352C047A